MVTILVEFTFYKDHAEVGKVLLHKLGRESLKEEGCIEYLVKEDANDDKVVILYEVFKNKKAQEFHKTTEHYKDILLGIIPDIVVERKVRYLK